MMNANSNHKVNGLGAEWGSIFQSGAGIFDSIMDSRTANKSNESMERQLELQLQAQREQSQINAARFSQTLKIVMIAGGVLLVGGVIFAVVKSSGKEAKGEKMTDALGKKQNIGSLQMLDGLEGKRRRKKKPLKHAA